MHIIHANALIARRFQPDTSLVLEGGVIAALGAGDESTDGQVLDLQGDYLLPGFVDVHIHAFMGRDTMDGEDAVRHMSRELRKQGVAAFLPTTMSASPEATLRALAGIHAVMDKPEKDGAAVLGAHMEAPFLQPSKAGAQLKQYFLAPTRENWARCTGEHAAIVRMITMAPELDGAPELIQWLAAQGVTISLGHTSATAETAHAAADRGATHVTHTFNAQSPLTHRAPGVPGAALVDDRLYCQFIGDGIHLHPDIVRLLTRCKGPDRAVAITDAMEAAGMPDGQYQLGGQDVFVHDGAARLADGTLAGSTLTMVRALQNLIRFGVAPADAALMTTQAPAQGINETRFGTLRLGAPAILARFGADWRFKGVVVE